MFQSSIPLPLEPADSGRFVMGEKVTPPSELYTLFICQKIFQHQGISWTPSEKMTFRGPFQTVFPSIYQDAHLIAQSLTLYDAWWQEDLGPLLALTADGIPCALLPSSKGGYIISRPDDISETILDSQSVGQFISIWRFIPQFSDVPLTLSSVIKLIHKSIQKEWLTWIGFQMVILLLSLGASYLSASIFDTAVPLASLGLLQQILLWLLLASILSLTLEYTQMTAFLRLSVKAGSTLQSALWDRLLRLPMAFHRRYLVGDMVDRASGFNSLQQLITSNLANSFLNLIFSVLFLVVLFFLDKFVALWALGISLILGISVILRSRLQLRYARRIRDLDGKITGFLFQSFKSMPQIKSSHAEQAIFQRWIILFNEKMALFYKSNLYLIFVRALETFLPSIAMGGLFAITVSTKMALGQFIFTFYIFNSFLSGISGLLSTITAFFAFIPTYRRLKPLMDEQPSYAHTYQDLPSLAGEILVKNLSFRYHPRDPLVLDDISFAVQPGQFIGIVGLSGSGKSTLLKMLMGLEIPQDGEILFDQHTMNASTLQSLRRQIGAVLQSIPLQAGSIIQNLGNFGSLSESQAWQALEWVQLDEEVRSWPMGLDTFLDEDGRSLSLGQRQRLIIAKALIKRPRILIFDEATSALDEKTQSLIQKHLESLSITRIFVAHRLSTIRRADRIYLFDQGRIVEQGDYEALKRQRGLFAQMAKRQEL